MIIIEGNIGAGKSTFLKLLAKASQDLEVAQEPLESWHKKEDGSNMTDKEKRKAALDKARKYKEQKSKS